MYSVKVVLFFFSNIFDNILIVKDDAIDSVEMADEVQQINVKEEINKDEEEEEEEVRGKFWNVTLINFFPHSLKLANNVTCF